MSPSSGAEPSARLSTSPLRGRCVSSVLAPLSGSYPPPEGRLPMHYSPVCHFTSVLLRLLARLACIRRAASVRSEPGSNSHKGVLRIWTKGHHFNTLTPLLNILYSVVKEQTRSSREPCTLLRAQKRVKGPVYQTYGRVFPKSACPHRTL